jgi:hypothetical protein
MSRIMRRLAPFRLDRGFTMIEVLVAGFVLVVGLVLMAQFFASAAGRVLDSDIRSVLHQVAAKDIESIRGLPYEDVGTTTGHPQGTLQADEDRTVQNVQVHIHRDIIYWTDPSYTGPYPANYRRVIVTVSAAGQSRLGPIEMTTNVAGGVPGGTLDVTVTNLRGDPVPNALIVITNDNLVPHVNINSAALRTDSTGHMIIPGLTPDLTPNYVVSVSKAGYNTDFTDPAVVVKDGLPYTVVQLTIDLLATLRVRVVDSGGAPVAGLNLSIIGPDGFDEGVVSGADGSVSFANIRYSTDLDPYVVRLLPGQGYDAQSQNVALDPGTTQEVVFTVPAGGPTTTTTVPPVTTSSTSSTSTTLAGPASLTVRVVRSGSGYPVSSALVNLEGATLYTNSSGYASFTNLQNRTYGIVVTRYNYYDYSGTVVVNGASTAQILLVHQ